MSEFPALRESLVAAAARRRRRRLTVRAAVPAFALAVAAVVLFLAPIGSSPPDRERVATPPASPLEQAYSVFRRPRTPEDAMPGSSTNSSAEIDRQQSRLVARDGASRLYAAPGALNGGPALCTTLARGSNLAGGCTVLSQALGEPGAAPFLGGGVYASALADGARDVRVMFVDGTWITPRVQANGVVGGQPGGRKVAVFAWTSAGGVRHIVRAPTPMPPVVPVSRCPRSLEPLGPDAYDAAARAALIAVDRTYFGATSATVTRVGGPPNGTPCAAAVSQRTLQVDLELVPGDPNARKSASLTHGRLLVGMVRGHLQVYYVMH